MSRGAMQVSTADVNEYKATVRPQLKRAVADVERDWGGPGATSEWLVLYVRPFELDAGDRGARCASGGREGGGKGGDPRCVTLRESTHVLLAAGWARTRRVHAPARALLVPAAPSPSPDPPPRTGARALRPAARCLSG